MATITIVDPNHPVKYSSTETPPSYKCGVCEATGCKLWREYNVLLEYQTLYCASCAGRLQKEDVSQINDDGERRTHLGLTDQIGVLMPAVPTEENDTFWGYMSVPQAGCEWWRRLPSLPQK